MAAQLPAEFLTLQRVVAGRYSLERELGRGGMGIVFLARDVALDRPVAIKLLPPALAVMPELRERFLREARTAAKLAHPNIVPIHSVEEHGDIVFFVMAFVDGESLGQRLRRAGPLAPSTVIRAVQEVAWALAYAHGRGVIHRDIKPDNILLEKGSGRVLVTDFGIARVADATGATARGEILGTAHYMAPEQASGEPADGRSDLYSLGVTAFYALTGTLPFDGLTLPAVLAQAVTKPAPKVVTRRDGLPPGLAESVDRCLAKMPADRFATGEELADAVGAAQERAREAPPQIRHLIRVARELDVWLAISIVVLYYANTLVEVLWPAESGTLVVFGTFVGVQILAAPVTLFAAMRRVLKAGLGPDDVRGALEQAIRTRVEEDELVHGKSAVVPPTSRRRVWRAAGIGLALGGVGMLVAGQLAGLADASWLEVSALFLSSGGVILIGTLAMRLLSRKEVGALSGDDAFWRADLFGRSAPRRRALGVGLRLLDGWLGRWLFRVAGLGLDVTAQNLPPATERTEILVGGAAGALFRGLPPDVRGRFPEVPNAIQRLEEDARLLRERERALSLALSQAAPDPESPGSSERREVVVAELTAARAAAGQRLAAAVAALENIRLDLLRLQAGVGSADDLTRDLEEAREVNEAVSAELAGRAAVEGLLRR
jgi:serine/threonine-protein kinase